MAMLPKAPMTKIHMPFTGERGFCLRGAKKGKRSFFFWVTCADPIQILLRCVINLHFSSHLFLDDKKIRSRALNQYVFLVCKYYKVKAALTI